MGLGLIPIKPENWLGVARNFRKINSLRLGPNSTPTFSGLTLSGLTLGSVLFAGTDGLISQDNSNLFWDDTNNRLGIGGTTSPEETLDIRGTDATGQFRIHYDSSKSFGFRCTNNGSIEFRSVGSLFSWDGAYAGVQKAFRVWNESAAANSGVQFQVYTQGDNAGDPVFRFKINPSGGQWLLGIDNSDSDKFKISAGSTPQSNTAVVIDSSLNIGFGVSDPDVKLEILKADTQLKLSNDGSNYITLKVEADGDLTIDSNKANYTLDLGDSYLITSGRIGVGTLTPDTACQIVGVCKFGDDNTNYMEVGSTGDVVFVGGAGLVFGAMGQENIPTTVTINAAGTAEIVDGMSAEQLNNVTFQNSQELKVGKAGMYFISWALSFNMDSGSGQEVEGAIGKGGTAQSAGSAHRKIGTGNDTGSICGSTILDLAVDDLITIMVTNESTTVDVVIAHASLSLIQVGGT